MLVFTNVHRGGRSAGKKGGAILEEPVRAAGDGQFLAGNSSGAGCGEQATWILPEANLPRR